MTKRVTKRVYYCCGINSYATLGTTTGGADCSATNAVTATVNRLKDYKMYSKKTNKVYHFNYCENCDTKYVYGIEEVADD